MVHSNPGTQRAAYYAGGVGRYERHGGVWILPASTHDQSIYNVAGVPTILARPLCSRVGPPLNMLGIKPKHFTE